jgi:hypothetical protein
MRGAVAALAATVVVLGGCGSDKDPKEAAVDTSESRDAVQEAMREVAGASADAGYDVASATGSWSTCGVEPKRSMQYTAGGTTPAGADGTAAAIAAIADALAAAGWAEDSAGETPRPFANLTKGDLRASLGESRREQGAVSVGVVGPCVETSEEQDALLGEQDDVPLR